MEHAGYLKTRPLVLTHKPINQKKSLVFATGFLNRLPAMVSFFSWTLYEGSIKLTNKKKNNNKKNLNP